MPLIVPILRLAMLFLNIYDSYKVLKPPLPSPRHANRPSLRAVTQRKRTMKGSLAVWIVWCCYILYERTFEGVVGLFVPFYDEVKSLATIFLILTRARGAEPIYLYLIRPFLKPYTETLDTLLDFMSLTCDIALAAIGVPVKPVIDFWKRRFGRGDVSSHDEPTDHRNADTTQLNGRVSEEKPSHEPAVARSQISRPSAIRKSSSRSSSTSIPKENGRPFTAVSRSTSSDATNKHEIWYPPPSAYDDGEDNDDQNPQRKLAPSFMDSQATLVTVEEVDDWRQYPQFPAAYPPTPLVTLTRLAPTTLGADVQANGSTLPKIDEAPKQGFRQSLSPPLEIMDSDSDGNLSDNKVKAGVHQAVEDNRGITVSGDPDVSMADTSKMDEEEEEDEFNMTLRTPIPVQRVVRALVHASNISRSTSLATTISKRSLSTGLSTVDNGSSLRTRSSLDSLSSGTKSSGEDSPVIGKKRPLPRSRKASNRNTIKITDPGLDSVMTNDGIKDERHPKRHAPIMHSSKHQSVRDDGSKASEVKKRRITSPNKIAVRVSKPLRPRLAHAASPPATMRKPQRKNTPEKATSLPETQVHGASALRTITTVAGSINNAPTSGATIGKSAARYVRAPQRQGRKFDENS